MPNFAAATSEPGSLRLALNAIHSIDDFVGIFYVHMEKQAGRDVPADSDDGFRREAARKNAAYRFCYDVSAAYKHGFLVGSRLVKNVEQVSAAETFWDDDSLWDDNAKWLDDSVFINFEVQGKERVFPAYYILEKCVEMIEELLHSQNVIDLQLATLIKNVPGGVLRPHQP